MSPSAPASPGARMIVVGAASGVGRAAVVQKEVSALELGLEEWERVMAINARAPFLLVREVAPPTLPRRERSRR